MTFEKSLATLTEGAVSGMEETWRQLTEWSSMQGDRAFCESFRISRCCALKEPVQWQGRHGEPEQEKMNSLSRGRKVDRSSVEETGCEKTIHTP